MKFTVLGGDLRSVYLCRRLMKDGFMVHSYGLELSELPHCYRRDSLAAALEHTDCVVLPIPAADGCLLRAPYCCAPIPLEAVEQALPSDIPVFGGGACPFPITDLTSIESMAVGNAALTAQSALLLILQNTQRSLAGQKLLILGAGRIGTLLGLQLKALGAEVTLTSRDPARRAWCSAMGITALHTDDIDPILPAQHMVINTIPARVLTDHRLSLLADWAVPIELASMPGGFSITQAEAMGLHPVIGRGLPGKYTPAGAADIIAETIYKELNL